LGEGAAATGRAVQLRSLQRFFGRPNWQREGKPGLTIRAGIITIWVKNGRINMSEAGTRMNSNQCRVRWIPSTIVAGVLLAGCASSTTVVESRENLLVQSGFRTVKHGTPAYAVNVQKLEPYRFGHHTVGGVITYYYRDPMVCECLYVGTEQNWATYKVALADQMHMDAEKFLEQDDLATDNGG
jgi:hypothetical protein